MGLFSNLKNKIVYSAELLTETKDEDEEAIKKGKDFEEYIGSKLFPEEFNVTKRAADNFKTQIKGDYIKNKYPFDFEIAHKYSKEVFAIECKYRSFVYYDKEKDKDIVNVTKDKAQLEKYKTYSKENKIPVILVVGVGGTPKSPERMFAIPLEDIKYFTMYDYVIERYERIPTKVFYWKNKLLL